MRKVKELDPYIKARVGEALIQLTELTKQSNNTGTSRLYYTGNWAKDIYDNYTEKQAEVIFKKVDDLKSKLTFSSFKVSIASLTCLVFLDIGLPKVECDKKATFGSKPKSFDTLTQDFEISTKRFDDGKSSTLVSATSTVLPLNTIIVIPKIGSPFLASQTCFNFSIDAA